MPKKYQVSVRGEIYTKIKTHCKKHEISIANFIDRLCSDFFKPKSKTKSKLMDYRDARF